MIRKNNVSKPLKEDYIIRIKSSIDQLDNEGSVREEAHDQIELMTRGSLVKKGYVEKIRSEEDKRTYHLHPTQKFMEYNRINLSYLQTIVERCEKRFTTRQLQTLEEMLNIINNELMPEINLDDRKKRQRNLNVMSELEN